MSRQLLISLFLTLVCVASGPVKAEPRDRSDFTHINEDGFPLMVWNPVTGEAESGLFACFGLEFQPLVSTYSVWFAREKYRPDTALYPETTTKLAR